MGTPCSWDMKPRMEKMANPATKLVPLLRKQRAMQSLWVRWGGGNRQVRKGCSVSGPGLEAHGSLREAPPLTADRSEAAAWRSEDERSGMVLLPDSTSSDLE